jgi:hypothetical protein
MNVLFAAEEHAWGGILNRFRHALPDVEFVAACDNIRRLQAAELILHRHA